MPMTMSQKILASYCGVSEVTAGEFINAKVDFLMANDVTAPVAIREFNRVKNAKVFDKDKLALVLDHYNPAKDIAAAQQCKDIRDFARQHDITHFYDVGEMGVDFAVGVTRVNGKDCWNCWFMSPIMNG